MTQVTSAEIQKALDIAEQQEGKPYTQNIPGRFGTSAFDCSGLVWYAMSQAGIPMPGGASNDAAAIVDPEIQWAAAQPGAQVITDASKVQAGDIVGFYASDATTHGSAVMNPDGKLQVGNQEVPSMGHIGIADGSGNYVSAYDTQSGVISKPITSDAFTVAVRLKPGNYSGQAPTGGNSNPSGGSGQTECAGFTVFGHCFGATVPSPAALWGDAKGYLERAGFFLLGGAMIVMGLIILVHGSPAAKSAKSAVASKVKSPTAVAESAE